MNLNTEYGKSKVNFYKKLFAILTLILIHLACYNNQEMQKRCRKSSIEAALNLCSIAMYEYNQEDAKRMALLNCVSVIAQYHDCKNHFKHGLKP